MYSVGYSLFKYYSQVYSTLAVRCTSPQFKPLSSDVKPRGLASASRPKILASALVSASWVLASALASWVLASAS